MNHVTAAREATLSAAAEETHRPLSHSALGVINSDSADAGLFAAMRFILAFTALAVVYIDPTQPSSREAVTYGALALYFGYAAIVLIIAYKSVWAPDQRLLCAFDVMFASMLVLWTQGTNSILFYVFLFPILVVSFSHGYRDGLIFTIGSVVAFIVTGFFATPPIVSFELNLALIRPIYLLVLGYMIAKWGGREILFKRRLMLLRDVNSSNPRARLDQTIEANLRRILDFHGAERCVLALQRTGSDPRYVMHTVAGSDLRTSGAQEMTVESGERLLRFKHGDSILYSMRDLRGSARGACVAFDCKGEREATRASSDCEFVAALLEASYFVTVPYSQSDGTRGRLFLASSHSRFTRGDIQFLRQFTAAVSKVVENLQLLDELVSSAAEHERAMISRDIHDAAVQPYIGLRLGLEALYREGGEANPLSHKIQELMEMANATVHDLRGYTRGLLSGAEIPGGSLGAAILMQTERHRRFYGLEITTDVDPQIRQMSGRLASQVFYVVVEALSNVVKHTAARRGFVEVQAGAGFISVRVGNKQPPGFPEAGDFVPKSIESRMESLGGSLKVQHAADGYTVVHAILPI